MKFYPASVLKLSNLSAQNVLDGDGNIVTRYVKVKNEKSKVSRPYMETFSYINTDPNIKISIDRQKECLDYAIEYGIIEQTGGWITMVDKNGEIQKVNGKAAAARMFKQSVDLYTVTKMSIYSKGLPPELFIVKFDDIKNMLEIENRMMKEKKMDILKISGRSNMISEEDMEPFKFDLEDTPKTYLDEETFNIATFNLMSYEEQQEYKSAIEKNKALDLEEIKLVENKEE